MKLQFFAIPAIAPDQAQAEFNRLVASHRVARVDKELITDHPPGPLSHRFEEMPR